MSFNSLIRAYMEKVNEDKEAQSATRRPSWLRWFGSAAIGLGLGMLSFGCGSGDNPTSEDPTGDDVDGKMDATGKIKCTKNSTCKAGQYCKKVSGPVVTPKYGITPAPEPTVKYGINPTPKYGITPATGVCAPVPECSSDNPACPTGLVCDGITNSGCPEGAYCILPPTPQTGICTIECSTTADCTKGETCVGASAGSTCPSGAYCILPPTPPKKGLCQVTVTPKYGVPTPTPKYGVPVP